MVVPASPALIKLKYDEDYRRALQNADLALADSGLVVALWRIATGRKLRKISGIAYLRCLLERDYIRSAGNSFWVVSSDNAKEKAIAWLGRRGLQLSAQNFHVAARRGDSAEDHVLLLQIEKQRPSHIAIALGTGIQEKLALYLREYLLYRPNIHCIGAALGFLTGEERPIPDWAERYNLGWLFRLLSQPRMFLPRLGIAYVLAKMVFKYRAELPPLQDRWVDL
jgi:exopolysaccharide biosynthesis WecB/TagA/CpsF family protein